MMLKKLGIVALLAASAAACQQQTDNSDIAIDNGVVVNGAVETLPPDESPGTETPVANASNNMGPGETRTIPAAFHGRWGMVPGDCTSTRGDAKGLIVIDGGSIRFYEAVARPAMLTLIGDRRIDGNYTVNGEGSTWNLIMRMEKSADGKTLTRTIDPGDSAPPPEGVKSVYTRCA